MKGHLEPTPEARELIEGFVAQRDALAAAFESGAITGGIRMARTLTDATDQWITRLWDAARGDLEPVCILAVGGYGRQELSFGSDLDLVLEVEDGLETSSALADAVARFMAWARLGRVKLAHAVRTPAQTLEAFDEDFRTPVSYLDARSLTGVPQVGIAIAIEKLRADDEGHGFVELLLEGYKSRLDRHGQTIYLLEPDLKSGKGALRDLHIVRWAGLVRGGFDVESQTDDTLGWSARERAAYREGHDWLLEVRGLLHAIHRRKHDRLHFPDQERLAGLLVESDDGVAAAAETLMRRHYKVTRTIGKLTERALRRWAPTQAQIDCRVDSAFRVGGGQLFMEAERPSPEQVFEALRIASEYDALLDPTTEERIESVATSWGSTIREDQALGRVLCGLLTDVGGSPRTSTRLLELGVLPAFVPEFEPVICHVQHDVYHVYTTDVHLLQCLEFARRLLNGKGPGAQKWPGFGVIAGEIEDRRVFLLAALFHDIGKNRGGGHSVKGAAMMNDVGPRLGLSEDQTDLLSFLVREHLSLSHAARRHDLADRRVVRDLAARIRTIETLNQLTALTFCDMSTVAPDVMNDWNASLLLQLHQLLRASIEHGVESAWQQMEQDVARIRDWLLEQVAADGQTRNLVDAFVRDLPSAHIVESAPDSLRLQFEAYANAHPEEPTILVRPDVDSASTEVVVSSPDIPGALARITGAISSLGLNILDARIVTTASGRLLDIFRVAQSGGASHALTPGSQTAVTDPARLEKLTARLRDVLVGTTSVEELLRKRIAEKKLAPRATPEVESSVEVLPEMSDDYTVLQIKAADRIGLLYEIARTLSHCDINIRLSKIDSLGTQVVDTFYIETLAGTRLDDAQIAAVVDALRDVCGNSRL